MTTKRQTTEYVDDVLNARATNVLFRIVDTNVVVIFVRIFRDLAQHHLGMQLWVGVDSGKHFRYYHIN